MNEAFDQLAGLGKYLYNNRYACGSAGNLSVRLGDNQIIATPTNSSLGTLSPDSLSVLDLQGKLEKGPKPSKEVPFHLAVYRNSSAGAVIHLHSTYLTALSCLADLNKENVFKPFTPYVVIKAGDVPLIPYYKPGSISIAEHVSALSRKYKAFLLANHGVIVTGKDITDALYTFEELEESARLFWLLRNENVRYLSREEISELEVVRS